MSYIFSTNFKLGGNLVLLNEEAEVVGVIRFEGKLSDISQKILNALYTYESAEKVEFTENLVMDTMEKYFFDAYITDFDGDSKLKGYTIELTATY